MRKCYPIQILVILLLLADLSIGQAESNETLTTNATNFNNTSAPDLKYIWSVVGIERNRIIVALDQSGADLFGRAKYEPENDEPWNGEVGGWVSNNRIYLAISALNDNKQILSILDGILVDQSISGKFFQTIEGEILDRGEFNATWLSPDISSYIPAKMPAITTNHTVPSDTNQIVQQTTPQKSKFYDVCQDPIRFILI